jgi:hypothetical protein
MLKTIALALVLLVARPAAFAQDSESDRLSSGSIAARILPDGAGIRKLTNWGTHGFSSGRSHWPDRSFVPIYPTRDILRGLTGRLDPLLQDTERRFSTSTFPKFIS